MCAYMIYIYACILYICIHTIYICIHTIYICIHTIFVQLQRAKKLRRGVLFVGESIYSACDDRAFFFLCVYVCDLRLEDFSLLTVLLNANNAGLSNTMHFEGLGRGFMST